MQQSIDDLHIWQISGTSKAVILTVKPATGLNRELLINHLRKECGFDHITLEISA